MKLIYVDSCATCPYKRDHYSGENSYGYSVYEGTSCKHPDLRNYTSVTAGSLGKRKIHKDCPLKDLK